MTAAEVKRQSDQAWREAHENDSVREREVASRAKRESLDSLRREILARKQMNTKPIHSSMRILDAQDYQEKLDSIEDVGKGTKTIYQYDEQNFLVSETIHGSQGSSTQIKYEYDEEGRLIKKIYYYFYSPFPFYSGPIGWELSSEYIYFYDSDGDPIGEEYYSYDSQTSIDRGEKQDYIIDEEGNFLLHIYYNWDKNNSSWTPRSKEENEYYSNSLLKSNKSYSWSSGKWVGSYNFYYEYDSEDRRVLYRSYSWNYTGWYLKTENVYKYDSKGRRILYKYLSFDYFGAMTSGTWSEVAYDSDDKVIDNRQWRLDGQTWTGQEEEYEYYDGDMEKCETFCFLSTYSTPDKRQYFYNQYGNLYLIQYYRTSQTNLDIVEHHDVEWSLSSETIYTYNEKQDLISEMNYSSSGTGNEYKYEYDYDENGSMIEKRQYYKRYDESEFRLSRFWVYEYDSDARLILDIEKFPTTDYNTGEAYDFEYVRNEYEYYDNGNVKNTKYGYSWGGSKDETMYDSRNNTLYTIRYKKDSNTSEWDYDYKYEYAYDDANSKILDAYYVWENGYWKGKTKKETVYDEAENCYWQIAYQWDDDVKDWENSSKSIFTDNRYIYASYTWSKKFATWIGSYHDSSSGYEEYTYEGYDWNSHEEIIKGYKYVHYHESGDKDLTLTTSYDYADGGWVLSEVYEEIVDNYGDLLSKKHVTYNDGEEYIKEAIAYMYDMGILGKNVLGATTYHKVIKATQTIDNVSTPINYYYSSLGNGGNSLEQELAVVNEVLKEHGYASITTDEQHVLTVNIDSLGYTTFPYELLTLPNLTDISAKGNFISNFSSSNTYTASVQLCLQNQYIETDIAFDAKELSENYPYKMHSTLKKELPLILQNRILSYGASEACLDEWKGYTLTFFKKNEDGERTNILALNVDRNEMVLKVIASDNIFEFESGETLYITNNGISDGVNAGSHCSCIVTFESGDANFDGLINIQDLQSVINYMVGDSNTIFCKNAGDAYHDGTINVQDIVCLVNTLLDAGYYSAPREMRAQRVGTNGSEIIVRGNDLVLVNNTDIAALDIKLTDDCQVEWCLPLGMIVAEEGNHIIAYSLNGDVIASGETVIAHVNGWAELDYANLCTKDAALVPCALRGITTSIKGIDNEKNSESIYSVDGRKRTIQGAGVNIRKYGNGTSKKTVHLK